MVKKRYWLGFTLMLIFLLNIFLINSIPIKINPNCGNGICEKERGETVSNCAKDCCTWWNPLCWFKGLSSSVCGNKICENEENEVSCSKDCLTNLVIRCPNDAVKYVKDSFTGVTVAKCLG